MTSLLFSCKEKQLITNLIDESYRLYGIDCTLYDLSSANLYLDDRVLRSGVPYKILLQDYIDMRLLSNLKWSTLECDREAIIALAPMQYCGTKFNLREFDVIKICNGDMYQIREINSAYLLNFQYALKLITYKDEPNRPREEKQMKTNFLRTEHEELE